MRDVFIDKYLCVVNHFSLLVLEDLLELLGADGLAHIDLLVDLVGDVAAGVEVGWLLIENLAPLSVFLNVPQLQLDTQLQSAACQTRSPARLCWADSPTWLGNQAQTGSI